MFTFIRLNTTMSNKKIYINNKNKVITNVLASSASRKVPKQNRQNKPLTHLVFYIRDFLL